MPPDCCQCVGRLNGKFLSVKATVRVQQPAMVAAVFDELGKDARVIMKF